MRLWDVAMNFDMNFPGCFSLSKTINGDINLTTGEQKNILVRLVLGQRPRASWNRKYSLYFFTRIYGMEGMDGW